MTNFENQIQQFDEKLCQFLLKVQTNQSFESDTIDELNTEMNALVMNAKNQQLLSRKLLWIFRAGAKVLNAEIPYAKTNANALSQLSSKLEASMDLILLGESPSDRMPGVPRII